VNNNVKPIRTKPQQSQLDARSYIDQRHELLKEWRDNGIPYLTDEKGNSVVDNKNNKMLEYYPKSPSAFCKWNLKERNSESLFDEVKIKHPNIENTFAIKTLQVYDDMWETIENLIEQLKKKEKAQKSKKSDKAQAEFYKQERDIALLRKTEVEKKHVFMIAKLSDAEKKHKSDLNRLESLQSKYDEMEYSYSKEISELADIITKLKEQIRNKDKQIINISKKQCY